MTKIILLPARKKNSRFNICLAFYRERFFFYILLLFLLFMSCLRALYRFLQYAASLSRIRFSNRTDSSLLFWCLSLTVTFFFYTPLYRTIHCKRNKKQSFQRRISATIHYPLQPYTQLTTAPLGKSYTININTARN